ncbi:Sodium/iodide cotransporter, partial [Armadillidium nasatum]
MQLSMMTIGMVLANIFTKYLILPILYPLKIISINEYIELRFKSTRLCQFFSFINVLKNTIVGAIILFASTIALASMTNFGTLTNILLLGSICTLYSSIGGFKAIIWTDVFQFFLMVIGIGMVVAIGFYQNGGIIETLHTASNGGRLEMFDYAGCDPTLLGILKRKEEILPYFVMNKMGSIPGLPGIFVSAIISGLL